MEGQRNKRIESGLMRRAMRPALTLIRPEGTVAYIGGSDSLPAPLSREEEQALFARMQEEPEAAGILRTNMILGCAITESTGIYSLVIALLMLFVF